MKTGIADLPLHSGSTPSWLFDRMKTLARDIVFIFLQEKNKNEFLSCLSDPFWFQSFACLLGFDWHSSGSTTVVLAALKEGLKDLEDELGVFICGGKGKTSRKTPEEIKKFADKYSFNPSSLVYASKMAAKVDNAGLQDGYHLYHHSFIFTKEGKWVVIQQGMHENCPMARRYHWLSRKDNFSFVCDPHTGIATDKKEKRVLNLISRKSKKAREISSLIASDKPEKNLRYFTKIKVLRLPYDHQIKTIKSENLKKILFKTYERKPRDFQSLLEIEGVGPKTIRALSLIAEIIYGVPPSFEDPAKFSFAHGGKDGYPYPINKRQYDQSIEILEKIIRKTKIENNKKTAILKRLFQNE